MKIKASAVILLVGLMLTVGCGRDEDVPEEEKTDGKQESTSEMTRDAPDGYESLEEGIFITEEPPRVEDYADYLEKTGQEFPEWLKTSDIDYQDPLTGLSRDEAEQFATWQLCRLPTAEEWDMATSAVGDSSYPWDTEEVPEDAPVYLVRDWTEGSSDEADAREEKAELVDNLQTDLSDKVQELRTALQEDIDTKNKEIKDKWQSVKSELSDLVDHQKEHARKVVATEGRQTVQKILTQVGDQKKKVVYADIREGAKEEDIQKAADEYTKFLKEQIDQIGELQDKIDNENEGFSEEARDLMGTLEEEADEMQDELDDLADQDADPEPETDLRELAEIKSTLNTADEKVDTEADRILKRLDQAAQYTNDASEQLAAEIEDLDPEDETSARVDELKNAIKDLDEHLDMTFEHQEQLFTDLEEYVDSAATKRALETETSTLEELLDILQGEKE